MTTDRTIKTPRTFRNPSRNGATIYVREHVIMTWREGVTVTVDLVHGRRSVTICESEEKAASLLNELEEWLASSYPIG